MTLIIFNRKNATEDWLTVEMDKGRTRIHACNRRDSTDRRKKKEKGKKKREKRAVNFGKTSFRARAFALFYPRSGPRAFLPPAEKSN